MKTTLLLSSSALASFAAGALFLPTARSQSGATFATRDYGINLLGNPGFEAWGYGVDDSIPPELWRIDGEPANTFAGTGSLIMRRVPGESDCTRNVAGGEWAVELNAVDSGSFLSQPLENPSELRCKTVTLTARFKTEHGAVTPTITIDDGIGSSSDMRELVIHQWRTFSVTHKVSASATRVEVRIAPGSITAVDDVQLVLGDQPMAPFTPRTNPEPARMELPLGSVIDWYRLDSRIPIPEGYAICDGSLVTDPTSPFVGLTIPDMTDRFVRGVTDLAEIGTSGGADSHNLTHTHNFDHHHQTIPNTTWFWWAPPTANGFPCARNDIIFETGPPLGEPTPGNRTSSELGSIDNRPPFVGLLKIMRVR